MKQMTGARGALRVRPGDRAEAAELAGRLLTAFLLGRTRIYGGIAPFGIAFTAASGPGARGILALLGAVLAPCRRGARCGASST